MLEVRSVEAELESPVSGLPLKQGLKIDKNNKWIKIYDTEKGDAISNIIKL